MGKNSRDRRPYLRPVTRIELNTSNEKARWITAGVLLLIGLAALAFGFSQALSVQPGWEEVSANTQEASCAPDFKLQYDFSEAGGSAAVVNKSLIQCYSDASVKAYKLLTADVDDPQLKNMAYLNQYPNETVTVDPELYQALSQVARSGNRQLFLAPARVEYDRVFLCENEEEAVLYDPARNEDTKAWLKELAVFAADPQHVALEIFGENQVKLSVSPEYQAFAQEYGIGTFADFGWMRNAFAADMIADALIVNGFTKAYLVSFDGFARNLCGPGERFTQNIFDRQGSDVFLPARMHYDAPSSTVSLRDYPMTEQDRWSYYGFADGRILTTFLDPRDGMSKSALHNLYAYSQEKGCGEMVLELADIFIADSFQEEALMSLQDAGIFSLWPQGRTLCYNDPSLELEILPDTGAGYSKTLK